tara:strand:+ start:105 stop:260 length:156 start_codon:yes stop_codon:yes gene_type:complete
MQVTSAIKVAKWVKAASVTDVDYQDECQKRHKRGGGVVISGNFERVGAVLL